MLNHIIAGSLRAPLLEKLPFVPNLKVDEGNRVGFTRNPKIFFHQQWGLEKLVQVHDVHLFLGGSLHFKPARYSPP